MKAVVYTIGLVLFSSNALAATTYGCKAQSENDYSVVFTAQHGDITKYETALGQVETNPMPDKDLGHGSFEYSFLVDDSNDTKIWIVVEINGETVFSAAEWVGGNDSDNSFGSLTDTKIVCDPVH